MASLNKVTLIGNLGRDPEIRSTQNGSKLANLALATTEKWTDKQSGEKKEKTEWHKVVIYNERLADLAERYLSKGSQIYIEGALQTRKWTDNQGVEKYTHNKFIEKEVWHAVPQYEMAIHCIWP